MVEALSRSRLFLNRAPQVEAEESKAGVYKELALLELFLRNKSHNSRERQVFDICIFCL